MNKQSTILFTVLALLAVFGVGAFLYQKAVSDNAPVVAEMEKSGLIRPHSPVLGQANAPVTIVEFFDPSCEACRAFFPIVEDLRKRYPEKIRIVLRYADFHPGSDEAVRLLEAARLQDKFEPVLEALFTHQPRWAAHGTPDLNIAWDAARAVGLDIERAKADAKKPQIEAVLVQDRADIKTHNVRQTPTFYINGKLMTSIGEKQMEDRIQEELKKAKP